MKRIIIICEGQTEQAFCNRVLQPFFSSKEIYLQAALIKSSKGGMVKWAVLKKQIEMHLKTDTKAFVTTFIDYYGTYSKYEFPNWDETEKIIDPIKRMTEVEDNMKMDLSDDLNIRFIPNIQLHEFEGLLFNDIKIFHNQFRDEDIVDEDELKAVFNNFENPELINNSKETAPSKRLERIIKGYKKVVYGDILAEAIGLIKIRAKSPRFNNWIEKLSKL